MLYLPLTIILTLFSLPTFASQPNPDRQYIEPPNYGQFVGVKATAYDKKGIPNQGVKKYNIHPGVVLDGPDETGRYQVAMISKNLPHNPPQQSIHDYHPGATTYGNVDLSPPKNIRVPNMRVWLSKETHKEEPPMTQGNVRKLKEAMVPHRDWKAPPPPPPPPSPPPRAPKQNQKGKGYSGFRPNAQGGGPAYPQHQSAKFRPTFPATQQHASSSRGPYSHPPANVNAVASSSKHTNSYGYAAYGSQAVSKAGPSHQGRPNSPSKRPYPPLARPGPSSSRPYPPPKPHIQSGGSGSSSSKRPGSPSDRSKGKAPAQRQGKSSPQGSRSPSPQPQRNNKGKGRQVSPSRKTRST